MKFLNGLKSFESLVAFLVLECLALTSFALGGVNYIFQIIGFLLSVIAFLLSNIVINKNYKWLIYGLFASLIAYSLCTGFSSFLYEVNGNMVEKISSFLAVPGFLLLGFSSRNLKSMKADYVLYAIGGGLALILVISTIATLIMYGPFYATIYKDTPIYYYNAHTFDVTKEMMWLVGFRFEEISLKYAGLVQILLVCFLPALMFINPKTDKKKFVFFLSVGSIGLLSILFILNLTMLIYVGIVGIIAVLYKFFRENKKFNKVLNLTVLGIFALVCLSFIVVLLNNSSLKSMANIQTKIANNAFLNRIFNTNKIMDPLNKIIKGAISSGNLLGLKFPDSLDFSRADNLMYSAFTTNAPYFEAQIIKESGILGLIFFIAFGVFAYLLLLKYKRESGDESYLKITLLSFLLLFVLYLTFNFDSCPYIHYSNKITDSSFVGNLYFLISLFIVGFCISSLGGKENEEK